MKVQLSCPIPSLDFDVITLGHGSGGLLTNRLLDEVVFKLLHNVWLDSRHDGALLTLTGKTAFSTDSFVVSPIFFAGGNIGDLAVNGTVNDLAMCGAIPQYLSLGFILEEGFAVKDLWSILLSIAAAAEKSGVKIVTGDTKVVERGKGDGIFINTSGIGAVHANADIAASNVKAGDKIIVSGNVASHGIAILSMREGLEFETTIQSDTANLNHTVKTLLDEFGNAIHLLRDPTRGGVATVLNEIAKTVRLGIEIIQTTIPILDEVNGACEILGLDPLYVANEGIFLAFVAPDVADACLERLRQDENGATASIIGEVVAAHAGQVVLKSGIGGRRVVGMLAGEQLPRIC